MQHQLTILTDDRPVLELLVRSALEHEKRLVQLGMAKAQQRLAEFEQRYGMSSAEFERQLFTLELAETPEFSDWRMEVGMLRLLERQYTALHNARVH